MTNKPKNHIKTIFLSIALGASASVAHANLGDNLRQSINRYGQYTDRWDSPSGEWVGFSSGEWRIAEYFSGKSHRVECITYYKYTGVITRDEVGVMLRVNVPSRYHNHWVEGNSKHVTGEDEYNVFNTYDHTYHYEDGWLINGLAHFNGNCQAYVTIETYLGWSDRDADSKGNNNNDNQRVNNDTTVPI
jgi:hypothetical protein